ncbi:hypothetical protein Q5H93_04635 [Hymenobacter sp. ASUV-10]|uniref:DUF4099 domain-containing protein n=1 Tax=Hymenobacter aranciens TaxID=3063996 RepID=A0ABT9B6W3_9BACT|nr:hypothetical protein [Hymenobacter sp. ASUV-10]MDO7874011.1 hypothetical protein [Hymenobacter sp. ASUV-10]
MKLAPAFATVLLATATTVVQAQDDGPRQLGAPPSVPTAPARPAPAPRQLGNAPATTPDTVRRAAAPVPPAATEPVYAPTPPGQIPGGTSAPTRYQVGLKGGMVYNVRDVETRNPLFGHSYLLLDGQRKIDFKDVGFYEDETGHYVRTTLPNSSREATFRRDKTGRISLYSITTTQYNPGGYPGRMGYGYGGFGYGGMGGYPYGGYRTVKTEYFSKDNGPIQDMNMRNLMLATRDHAGAQQLLVDARRYQRGIVASYVVGGGLLVGGLIQTLQPNTAGVSPLVFAALPVLIIPIVLQSKQVNNQKQAIALYNNGN